MNVLVRLHRPFVLPNPRDALVLRGGNLYSENIQV